MKKHLQILSLLAAMLLPWVMQGQTYTLTVANGSTENQYIPVYSYYMDNPMMTQCIYPDDSLVAMRGNAITELKFYSAYDLSFTASTVMSMGVTTDADLASGWTSATLLEAWSGNISISGNELVITLETPYEYPTTGGNLVIEFANLVGGNCGTSSDKFYGVSLPNMSRYQAYSGGTPTPQSFLPKCTFSYASIACPAPTGIEVSEVGSSSATISWSDELNSTWILYYYPTDAPENMDSVIVSDTVYYLTDLRQDRNYTVKVGAVCDTSSSFLRSATFTTLLSCYPVTNLTCGATTPTGAIITWGLDPSDPDAQVLIEYKVDTVDEWDVAEVVTGFSYAFANLTDNTNYNCRVSSLCSNGDTSNYRFVNFTTASFRCTEMDSTSLILDTIGGGTNTDSYFPTYSTYEYCVTQQIYRAEDFSDSTLAGVITRIGIELSSMPVTRSWDIYLSNTTLSTLSSFEPVSASDLVWSGSTSSLTPNAWNDIELDASFNYTGGNILVTFDDNTGSWSSGNSGVVHSVSSGISRYVYQDGNNYDPTAVISGGYSSDSRLNMYFFGGTCLEAASCASPAAAASYVATDSVIINWAAGSTESSWNVYYREGTSGAFTLASIASEQTWTFENLNPATVYTFRVAVDCEGDTDTYVSDVVVRTACGSPTSISEDFETYAAGSSSEFNPCWTKHVLGSSTYTEYPYVYSIGGTKAMYFYSYNSGGTPYTYCYLATPMMADSLSTYEVEFDMYREYNYEYYVGMIVVGAMSDPEDLSTFDTIAVVNQYVTGLWEPQYVSLENYHDTNARYIAFYSPAPNLASGYTYTYNDAYIDNIRIARRSSCPRPNRFHARGITATDAELTWDGSEDHMEVVVKWGTTNNSNAAIDSMAVTTNSYSLTGLTPNTTYYAWATAQCSEEASRTMDCSFTTAPACEPVNPNIENVGLNSATISWTESTLSPATAYTVAWKTYTDVNWNFATTTNTFYIIGGLAEDEDYMLCVTAQCAEDSAASTVVNFSTLARGVIGTDAGTYYLPTYPYYNYSISEQVYLSSELDQYGDTLNGIMFYANSDLSTPRDMKCWVVDTTISDLSTSSYVPSTDMTLVFDSSVAITTGWVEIPFTTPYVRDHNNNLVVLIADNTGSYQSFSGWSASNAPVTSLYGYSDGAAYSTTSFSDLSAGLVRALTRFDAALPELTCAAPHPVVASATDNSITVAWLRGLDENSWSVDYRQMGDTIWNTFAAATTDTFATVSGLNPSTCYEFRIGSNCTDHAEYATVSGFTSCGSFTAPYFEDFSTYSSNDYTINPCWMMNTTGVSGTPYTVNITNNGMMLLMPLGSYVMFPQFTDPVNTLQLRCDYVVADASIYSVVGVSSYANDILSFTPIDTIWAQEAGTPIQVTVPFDAYEGTEGYITIYSSFNQTYYDNIHIELIPACYVADSITITDITTTTADVNWQSPNNATGYIVEYGETGSTTTNTVSTTQTSVTLSGLQHSTTYDVRLYTVCGLLGDTSISSITYRFTTECAPVDTLPYIQDFDHCNAPALTYTGVMPNCWSRHMLGAGSYTTGSYLAQIYSGNASSGNYSLMLSGRAIVLLPEMPVSVDSLQLSFHDYNSSYSSYGLIVGVCDSNTAGCEASFVPVDTIQFTTTSGSYLTYNLASYTGTGRYIAFMNIYNTYGYDYSYHYLDDIVVDYLPSCMPAQNVRASANTATSVTLAWDDLRPATEWEVSYSTHAMSDPSTGITAIVNTNPYVINGLSNDTMYHFYVRTICGAGDTSIWSDVFTCRPGTWVMRANQTDTVVLCGGTLYSSGGPNGTYTNYENTTVILMPGDTNHIVSISGEWHGESCCDYIYVYDGIGTGGTELLNAYGSSVTIGPFVSTDPSGALTLMYTSDVSGNYSGVEVQVDCISATCRVRDVRLDTAYAESSEQLHVTWDAYAASYEIEYGNHGFTQGTGIMLTSTTNSVTITGLTGLTNYDVYVRGICDGADTGSWEMAVLTTALCNNADTVYSYDPSWSTSTSNYAPMGYSYYNYAYVQTLVDSAQLANLDGDITAFAFNTAATGDGSYYEHMDVYMANVPESDLSNNWIANDATHVFEQVVSDANLCYTTTGWQLVGMDNSFTWDGHSNLLITVARNHGSYGSYETSLFNVHNTIGVMTRYAYQDGSAYTVGTTSPEGSTGSGNFVGDILFFSCSGASCGTPVITGETHDYQSVTVTWNGSGNSYEVAIKETAASTWPDAIAVTGTTYTFNGLNPSTSYSFRVRQDCNVDSLGYSDWANGGAITDSLPCFAPDSLQVIAVTNATATLDWNTIGNESNWDIHVTAPSFDSVYRVAAHPATVSGFTAGVTYTFTVRALCGINLIEGDWSAPAQFTTATCPDVTGLTTSDVTAHSVTLNWTADPMAESWKIEYGYRGTPQGQGTVVTVNTNTYTVTGLSDETSYQFYVQAVCGTGWESEQWAEIFATTAASSGDECNPVSNLTVSDITENSALVTWFSESGSAWNVVVPEANVDVTVTEQQYALTGLLANTNYNVKVRTACDNGEYSDFVTTSFMTNQHQEEGIDGVETMNCTIYPNPTSSATTISVSGVNGKVKIAIVDMNGRTVATETVECASDCVKTMDVENLAQGAYFVRITGESVNMVKKLVVR